ncbi:MAG TPA: GyrI-like domain-containing protein [Flavobacteriales bacterium]|nr:GyrI-like domain-containing protein [Flavobacteriales bacterium]
MENIQPKIENVTQKYLVGKRMSMSLANNKTGDLWKSFMPHRHAIKHPKSEDLYSVNIFDAGYYKNFNPANEFTKWACAEVSEHAVIPAEMERFVLPAGLYAVFHYKGLSTDKRIFHYIFSEWLPASGYALDDRPHFEILGSKYKNNDPDSEEDIYIPVKSTAGTQTMVLENDITVFYVTASSFPEGIMEAHQKLQTIVPFSKERRIFGISRPENGQIVYRAAAEVLKEGEGSAFGCETLVLKKGTYIQKTVNDFVKNIAAIGQAFDELLKDPRIDPQGYCVEWYIDGTDVQCMVRLAN